MSAQYVTLAPVTYLDGGLVREVVKAGVIITLDATQAAALAGSVSYFGPGTTFVDQPRVVSLGYDTFASFPVTGNEQSIYLDKATGTFYRWSDGATAYVAISDQAPSVTTLTSSVTALTTALTAYDRQKVQVTDNCYGSAWSGQTVTSVGTYEFFYNVGVSATDIRVGFGQWLNTGATGSKIDVDTSTSVTFSAAVKTAAGNVYALTFNGVRSITLPGGGFILSDPLSVEFTKGEIIWVRIYLSSGTADFNRSATPGGVLTATGGFTTTTDLTATGAAAVTAGGKDGWGPRCIIGTPLATSGTPKAVIIQGDSIGFGCYDAYTGDRFPGCYLPQLNWVAGGYLARCLAGEAGVINNGLSSDAISTHVATAGHFRRGALTRFARYAILEYGIVDLAGGRTAVQLQTDLLTQANRNLAKGVIGNIVITMAPAATSTDNFGTVGNQTTTGYNTARVTHNNWVRDGGPIDPTTKAPVATGTANALRFGAVGHSIKGYIEVADVVESARDSGKWKAANRVVTDGAITTGTSNLNSATGAFTSADVGRIVIIPGAGAAGAALVSTIWNINSSTQVAIEHNASATVSAQTVPIGPMTDDGIHPRTNGHADIAAAVKAPLLALLT